MSQEDWETLLAQLQGEIGDTWGGYATMLRDEVEYRHEQGQTICCVRELFGMRDPDPKSHKQDRAHTKIRTSYTPEDKFGPAGYDAPGTAKGSEMRYIPAEETLDYRVEFWNKPEAEVPTQDAIIIDFLDPAVFDLSTLQIIHVGFLDWDLAVSSGQVVDTRIDCRSEMDIAVEIKAGLGMEIPGFANNADIDENTLVFWFHTIDPETGEWPEDPMEGFLPPFNPETEFEIGWIEYVVDPVDGLATGTQLTNVAFVEFDFAGDIYDHPAPKVDPDVEPAEPAPWVNTIDAAGPTSQVESLPETTQTDVLTIRWNGEDDAGGSEIASYDIYVAIDNGSPGLWLDDTTDVEALFVGDAGHTYSFYSVATDNISHDEDIPEEPDATTTIDTIPVADAGGPYTVLEGQSVQLDATNSSDRDGDALAYAWDLDDDGQYDDAAGPTPDFDATGLDGPTTVTVGLRVTDKGGTSSTATATITVENAPPTADAGGPYSTNEGKPVVLSAAASSDPADTITAYEWDLDNDGVFETTGEAVVFPADEVGTFTVGLRVTDDDEATDTTTFQVEVAQVEPIDLGVVDFGEFSGLNLAEGNVWYQLTTAHLGTLTVIASSINNGAEIGLYTTRTTPPLVTSTGTPDSQRLDHSVQAGKTYLLKVTGDSTETELTVANLVATVGVEIQVLGTEGADHFEFAPTGSYLVTINDVEYHFDDIQYERIVFTGSEENDTVTLTGGPDNEIARFFPDHGTFGENGFLVTVNNVVEITAHGGGGYDSAFMYDSPGDDEFIARKGYGKMSGEGFVLETFDFMVNYGYATTRDGGNDVAYMEDAPGRDKFKFDWPKPGQFFGKMYGGGVYYNRAKNFEKIEAAMVEGKNTVRLFDSEGDDTFYGQKEESRLIGDGFDLTVSGYNTLAAFASTGNDIAYLEDSDDDDTTRARPHKITLWGGDDADPTYEIMARRFDDYHFEGTHDGFDRAKLHDTVLDDYAHASGSSASLYAKNGELDLLYEVAAFEWVRLYASEGEDTVEKEEPLDFSLIYTEMEWDELP